MRRKAFLYWLGNLFVVTSAGKSSFDGAAATMVCNCPVTLAPSESAKHGLITMSPPVTLPALRTAKSRLGPASKIRYGTSRVARGFRECRVPARGSGYSLRPASLERNVAVLLPRTFLVLVFKHAQVADEVLTGVLG